MSALDLQEVQPVAIGFNPTEVKTIRTSWRLLDELQGRSVKMVGAWKSRLHERIMDVVWNELLQRNDFARKDARQRLTEICEDIQKLK